MFKKYIKKILKVLVSAAFLFWVIFKVDWMNVWHDFQAIRWPFMAAYVVAILLGMIISAYKWKMLANYKEIKLSFSDFFKYYLTGTFINNFMPSFIGGDTFKAYESGKAQGRYVEAASSVIMDRITGLFGATILAMFFTLLNFMQVISNKTLLIANFLVALSFLVDIFIMKVRNHSFWARFKKYFPDKLMDFIIDLGTYSNDRRLFRKVIMLSFAFYLVGVALANYILFVALGIKIDLIDYLSVIFLISIISSIPVSINNIGIKEWAYIAFFGVFGVSASAAVTAAIISRFIQMIISFFALPVYLSRTKKPSK